MQETPISKSLTRGYKTVFKLNSTEHEILSANKLAFYIC